MLLQSKIGCLCLSKRALVWPSLDGHACLNQAHEPFSQQQQQQKHFEHSTMTDENDASDNRVSKIQNHLRIRLLYEDNDCIVIDKPRNLRSVPGHAHPPPSNKRKRDNADTTEGTDRRRTGQEAWVLAIQSFGCDYNDGGDDHDDDDVDDDDDAAGKANHNVFPFSCLRRLAENKESASSVPRKYKVFRRYIERSQKRLFPKGLASEFMNIAATSNDTASDQQNTMTSSSSSEEQLLDKASMELFQRIQERQQPLLNIPEATRLEDSAFGQLILMGYGKGGTMDIQEVSNTKSILVVHRLDCQVGTSKGPGSVRVGYTL